MSTPPRRPRWPFSLIRTSYQVGRPWMFDGKMLRELAGIPMRKTDLANSALALAEPDPLTLANLTTKSLTLSMLGRLDPSTFIPLEFRCGLVPLNNSRSPWPGSSRPSTSFFGANTTGARPWMPGSSPGKADDKTGENSLVFQRPQNPHFTGRGRQGRPRPSRAGICPCPRRRSGSARRTARNAGRHPRP